MADIFPIVYLTGLPVLYFRCIWNILILRNVSSPGVKRKWNPILLWNNILILKGEIDLRLSFLEIHLRKNWDTFLSLWNIRRSLVEIGTRNYRISAIFKAFKLISELKIIVFQSWNINILLFKFFIIFLYLSPKLIYKFLQIFIFIYQNFNILFILILFFVT